MSDEPTRITVSRDALRADLAEMELRIRIYFDEQLRHKADASHFIEVANKLDKLDRGEWTDTHRRALVELIEENTTAAADRAWSRKERIMGVLAGSVTLATFLLSLVIAFRGGRI